MKDLNQNLLNSSSMAAHLLTNTFPQWWSLALYFHEPTYGIPAKFIGFPVYHLEKMKIEIVCLYL